MATEKPPQSASEVGQKVQSTTERVAHATHEAVEALSEYGSRTEQRLRESGKRAADRTREYAEEVGGYVRQRPVTALAIALAAGFLMGALSRRHD